MGADRVDYDQIASAYDGRYQATRLEGTARALSRLARDTGAERILEVGCGTCRWLAELRDFVDQAVGLDPSTGMLREARAARDTCHLIRGCGERLPFRDGSFDLVICVSVIHHLAEPRAFVLESGRVLRSGGRLAVVGGDPRTRRGRWYVYDYFAGAYEMDLKRFPSWETVVGWMVEGGFGGISRHAVEHISDAKVGRRVLSGPFLQRGAVSTLALLTDEVYAAGVRRIQQAVAEAEAHGEEIVFPAELDLCMLVGDRGASAA